MPGEESVGYADEVQQRGLLVRWTFDSPQVVNRFPSGPCLQDDHATVSLERRGFERDNSPWAQRRTKSDGLSMV